MITIPKAFVGYNQIARAYVPYSGNLTEDKIAEASRRLRNSGFTPGWKTRDVQIGEADRFGRRSYREDGASGYTQILVFESL